MTTRVPANGIEIVYENMGSPDGRPLLLIMGLGAQLIHWDEDLCRLLAEQGHHVVRYDNRDAGLSTHLPQAGDPPYFLEDMADDAAGLLDALGWDRAHIVGASMGGMIAQALAIRHPDRVLTLTSIMSTPGPSVSPPTEAALGVLMSVPPSEREALIEHELHTWSIIGSPGFPLDREWIAWMTGTAYDRAWDPEGTGRQLAAIMASPDRTEALAGVRVPTLVIHGEDDQLVPLAGGQATAAAVPGARLLTFPGMGHDFPRPLWPEIVGAITKHTAG